MWDDVDSDDDGSLSLCSVRTGDPMYMQPEGLTPIQLTDISTGLSVALAGRSEATLAHLTAVLGFPPNGQWFASDGVNATAIDSLSCIEDLSTFQGAVQLGLVTPWGYAQATNLAFADLGPQDSFNNFVWASTLPGLPTTARQLPAQASVFWNGALWSDGAADARVLEDAAIENAVWSRMEEARPNLNSSDAEVDARYAAKGLQNPYADSHAAFTEKTYEFGYRNNPLHTNPRISRFLEYQNQLERDKMLPRGKQFKKPGHRAMRLVLGRSDASPWRSEALSADTGLGASTFYQHLEGQNGSTLIALHGNGALGSVHVPRQGVLMKDFGTGSGECVVLTVRGTLAGSGKRPYTPPSECRATVLPGVVFTAPTMDANDYDEAGSSSQVQFRVGDNVWCGYLHCEVLASAGNNYTLKGPHGRICCSAAALSLYPPSGAPPLELLEQELNLNTQQETLHITTNTVHIERQQRHIRHIVAYSVLPPVRPRRLLQAHRAFQMHTLWRL